MARPRWTIVVALALALVPAGAARAQIPGGLTSGNVRFVKNFARHSDTAGGRLVGDYYYVTTERDLSIYDVKDPKNPVLVGNTLLAFPGEPTFTEEDPDTNGKVLVVSNTDTLIYDVSDKTHPNLIGRLAGLDQHTMSCVLDCKWVYGSAGAIVDLRDPTNPKLAGQWNDLPGVPSLASTHDVTEVSPGIVVTSSEPFVVFDARQDALHPTVLSTGKTPGFMHGNLWPLAGTDNFLLVGGEAAGPGCANSKDATFMTLDARNWQTTHSFPLISQFRMSTGDVLNGSNVDSTWCTHWFGANPRFANGGLVGAAWYEQGVRFLKVDAAGKISEIGYWLPVSGQSSDVEWITDRVLYVADYLRGVDILEFTGDIPPSFPGNSVNTPAKKAEVSFDKLVTMPATKRCVRARTFRVRLRVRKTNPVTWARLRINGHRTATVRGATAVRRGLRARRLPRGRFSAQVEVRTRSGARTAGQRTYHGC
jgi:LVIVD repeat-containing protein